MNTSREELLFALALAKAAAERHMRKQIGGRNTNPSSCSGQLSLRLAHVRSALQQIERQARLEGRG